MKKIEQLKMSQKEYPCITQTKKKTTDNPDEDPAQAKRGLKAPY